MLQVKEGSGILVVGATGGIGRATVKMLAENTKCIVGAHGCSRTYETDCENVISLQKNLNTMADCEALINAFVEKAGRIDGLIVLSGGIQESTHWTELSEESWLGDINTHLNVPFFLSRAAFRHMQDGGKIILNGTESALHGGSPTAFAYGVAKHAIECMVKGLAKDGAKSKILVNGIRFGFINSGFHERWQGKTREDLQKRAEMVPLGRAGTVDEAASLICYLMSPNADFITGQMIALTGGDWL